MTIPAHLSRAAPLALLCACGSEPPPPPAAEPTVLASFHPLAYFAERIAQGKVPVECPLPDGADPVTWRPDRAEVAALQEATLILANGASFEGWLDKVSLPPSRLVETTRPFHDRLLRFATVHHSHGPGAAHSHEGIDGHTWLDPLHAKAQSQAIHDALARAFPQHASTFAQGLAGLHRDLDSLHVRLQEVSARLGDTTLLATHPSYNYLAARYGWKVGDLELEPDAELTAADRERAAAAARGVRRAVLLWEAEPREATARALAELGLVNVVFSPAETRAAAAAAGGPDYVAVMRANADRLASALQ